MAICPYCGSQIGDEASICGFCGAKLSAAAEALATEIPEAEPVIEAAETVFEAPANEEFEGIPDDILGSVLGQLPDRQAEPKAEVPEVPAADYPVIPTLEELFDIPMKEWASEAPAVEAPEGPAVEIPEAPAVEIPEMPAAEPIPEAPEKDVFEAPTEELFSAPTEELPAAPAVEEAPVIPEAQPAYAQPVYAQPAEPQKKNKWLVPAIIAGCLALIGLLFALRGCSGKSGDPNVGVYKATQMEMYGVQLDPDELYDGGFVIELKPNGDCELNVGASTDKGSWDMENGEVSIDFGSTVISGTVADGEMKLENMLDMGLDVILEKQE